jgi:anti-anti-sigma regulatory factor
VTNAGHLPKYRQMPFGSRRCTFPVFNNLVLEPLLLMTKQRFLTGQRMLKVTTTAQNQTITLKLEGKLVGPWVQEVTRVWSDTVQSPRKGYVVDLRSVTFVDRSGQALLAAMSRQGAQFIAADCLTRNIVDEIKNSDLESGTL